nr:uncharacterized protein LOC109167856 [Ipomoea batatas]GMC90398.1 uncharacterized protein LOC109167856 [Ipomoea batatas]
MSNPKNQHPGWDHGTPVVDKGTTHNHHERTLKESMELMDEVQRTEEWKVTKVRIGGQEHVRLNRQFEQKNNPVV